MEGKFFPYRESARMLVEAGGGEVSEERFVEIPGMLVLSTHQGLTDKARRLFDSLNIPDQSDNDRLAEFIARITYLSFILDPDRAKQESVLLHQELRARNHTSPYETAEQKPNVLVAGLAIETLLEIVANKYPIGRLTSSRTAAMNSPLLRIPEGNNYLRDQIRNLLREITEKYDGWRKNLDKTALQAEGISKKDILEFLNMLHPGTKAGQMVVAADPDFWQKKLSRRLKDHPDGVERELLSILRKIADALSKEYPGVIESA